MNNTILSIGIPEITGRPLHSYGIDDAAYGKLQLALARSLPNPRLRDLQAMPFVLWAAERFRRAFDGGHFTWAFLFDELGIASDQALGRALVMEGLSRFRRPQPARTEAGVIYLKTLAAEGGLPENLLNEGGRYRRIVIGLMTDIETLGQGMPSEALTVLAAQRAGSLPFGFRTDEFHRLFAGFANDLVGLKTRCPAGLPSEAREAWLDAQLPDWRQDLPLRIGSTAARSLLSEAIRADRQDQGRDLITRQLVRSADRNWRAQLGVAARSSLPGWQIDGLPAGLRRFRLAPDLAVSDSCPSLMISAEQDDSVAGFWVLRRESGPRTGVFDFPLEKVVTLQIMADGKVIRSFAPPGGAAVDPADVPSFWAAVPDKSSPATQTLRHLGSASVQSRQDHIWLLLPQDVEPVIEGAVTISADGQLGEGTLWRLGGDGFVFSKGFGYRYRIKTGADDDRIDRLIAQGPIIEGMRDRSGGPIWRGCPRFMLAPSNGPVRAARSEDMMWRAGAQGSWKLGIPKGAAFGTIQVGWRGPEGAVQAVESIRILPDAVRVDIQSRPSGGVLARFAGLPANTSVAMQPLPHRQVGFDGCAEFTLEADQCSTARLGFVVFDPVSGQRLEASVAKPGDRGWIIAPGDVILDHEDSIGLEELRGWRIAIPPDRPSQLQVRLVDTVASIKHPKVMITITAETALASFLPLFRGLLASGGPDAQIRLRLIVGPHESPRLILRRFVRQAVWTNEKLAIVTSDAPITALARPNPQGPQGSPPDDHIEATVDLTCINLECPELVVKISGHSDKAAILGQLSQDRGPWLLLPRDPHGMLRPPRPVVSPAIPAEIARFSEPFRLAGGLPKRALRVAEYAAALNTVNPAGGIGDIGLLGHLLDHVGDGSDLAVLDQVIALAQSPFAAVSLLMRCDPARVGDRLTLEDSSPFLWATTPITAWTMAVTSELGVAAGYLRMMGLDETASNTHAQQLLAQKLAEVMVRRADLSGHVVLSAVRTELFPRHKALFGRVPSELNQPETSLVSLARSAITRAEARDQLFDTLRAQAVPPAFDTFNPAVRGLTDIPIVAAEYATGLRKGPLPAHIAIAIQHFRRFDPTYFDTALPAAVAWLS